MDAALALAGIGALGLVVSLLSHRLHLPAPSLLVLAGVAVGVLPFVPDVVIRPDAVLPVVLPPLLFAGARDLPLRDLRPLAVPITLLSTLLVAATACGVALVAHGVDPDLTLGVGFTLGAILASTDPVAVAALARRLHLPRRLHVLVQGESLFNDATSLVLFSVASAVAASGHFHAGHSVWEFVRLAGGGTLVGAAATLWRGVGSSILTPYVAYVVADRLDLSGVTAVVVAGVIVAGRPRQRGRRLYRPLVFVLEGATFAAIGLELPGLVRDLPDGEHHVPVLVLSLLATVLVIRLVALVPVPVPTRVATWAGTRGVIPLAAALSLPEHFPHRELLLVVTSGVVIASLVVQGLTLEPLTRRVLPAE